MVKPCDVPKYWKQIARRKKYSAGLLWTTTSFFFRGQNQIYQFIGNKNVKEQNIDEKEREKSIDGARNIEEKYGKVERGREGTREKICSLTPNLIIGIIFFFFWNLHLADNSSILSEAYVIDFLNSTIFTIYFNSQHNKITRTIIMLIMRNNLIRSSVGYYIVIKAN